jgi:hypothetical protein
MWYYNLNNQPAGPVDEAALKTLFASGAINFDTLVWQEGMPAWVRLGETHIINQVVAAEAAASPTRQPLYIPGRPDSAGLKTLFIWWLVTACFFVLFMPLYIVMFSRDSQSMTELSYILTGLVCLIELVVAASGVLEYVLVYKLWKVVQDGYASTSAGKAVGFLFIPFFNYYWFFRAFWGLAKDLNKYIERHFPGSPAAEVKKSKAWISLTYLIFMFGGAILVYIIMMVLMMATMGTQGYDPYAAMSNPLSAMLPMYLVSFGYAIITWVLKTVMFIDFYRSAASILEIEERPKNVITEPNVA